MAAEARDGRRAVRPMERAATQLGVLHPIVAVIAGAVLTWQQLTTWRNIAISNVVGSRLVDLWYGRLNSQIEHRLVPTLARNRLPAARPIARFCAERGVGYTQAGVLQSYREILGFLSQVSAPLRGADASLAR